MRTALFIAKTQAHGVNDMQQAAVHHMMLALAAATAWPATQIFRLSEYPRNR